MPELQIFPSSTSAAEAKATNRVAAFAKRIHDGYSAGKNLLGGPLGPVSSHFSDSEFDLKHDYLGVGNKESGPFDEEGFSFAVEELASNTSCTLENNYGYDSGSPCIFFTLNSVWGFPNAIFVSCPL